MYEVFAIKGETLTGIANSIRKYGVSCKYSFDPAVVGANGHFVEDSVTVYYREYIDDPEGNYVGMDSPNADVPLAFSFRENNEGEIVPVFYDSNVDAYYDNHEEVYLHPDYEECHYYVGTAMVDGVLYDKWRKIEFEGYGDPVYTWNADAIQYAYTNVIISVNDGDDEFSPSEVPAKVDEVYARGFSSGLESTEGDAEEEDILIEKRAWVNGKMLEGTMKKIRGVHAEQAAHLGKDDDDHYVAITYSPDERVCLIPEESSIELRVPYSAFGDVEPEDVPVGKSFTSAAGFNIPGTGNPYTLYGTYLFKDKPQYTMPSEYISIPCGEAYTYFYDGSKWCYCAISEFNIGDDGIIEIYGQTINDISLYKEYSDEVWGFWVNNSKYLHFEQIHKIIDFKNPVTVSRDQYNLFMEIVDCDVDETPHDIGYDKGQREGYNVGYDVGYDVGVEKGKENFDGVPWDVIQNDGTRMDYDTGFAYWNSEYIRPKHKVVASVSDGIFYQCKNLKKVEAEFFDFSQSATQNYVFAYCPMLEEVEDIGIISNIYYQNTFLNDIRLHTIAKITVGENTNYGAPFMNCNALVNLTVDGIIGRNGLSLKWSTKLSKESIRSVLDHLSTSTSGFSVTFAKLAVDTAFVQGSTIGSETAAWQTLVADHSNWTINLA